MHSVWAHRRENQFKHPLMPFSEAPSVGGTVSVWITPECPPNGAVCHPQSSGPENSSFFCYGHPCSIFCLQVWRCDGGSAAICLAPTELLQMPPNDQCSIRRKFVWSAIGPFAVVCVLLMVLRHLPNVTLVTVNGACNCTNPEAAGPHRTVPSPRSGGTTGTEAAGMTGGVAVGLAGGKTGGVTERKAGGIAEGMTGGVTGSTFGDKPGGVVGGKTGGVAGDQTGGTTGSMSGGKTGGAIEDMTGGVPGTQPPPGAESKPPPGAEYIAPLTLSTFPELPTDLPVGRPHNSEGGSEARNGAPATPDPCARRHWGTLPGHWVVAPTSPGGLSWALDPAAACGAGAPPPELPRDIVPEISAFRAANRLPPDRPVRFFFLGDSVARNVGFKMAQRYEAGAPTQSEAKMRCKKQGDEARGVSCDWASSDRRVYVRFQWLQCLSAPPPAPYDHPQAWDGCMPFVRQGQGLRQCLQHFFLNTTTRPTDVAFVRVGFEYILFANQRNNDWFLHWFGDAAQDFRARYRDVLAADLRRFLKVLENGHPESSASPPPPLPTPTRTASPEPVLCDHRVSISAQTRS